MKYVFLCFSPYHLSIDYGIQGTENVVYNLKKKPYNFMKLLLIQIPHIRQL